jgi:hypothetical protein
VYREQFQRTTVESCRHRFNVRIHTDSESASCGLLKQITGLSDDWYQVERAICERCRQSFVPTAEKPNPVIASFVYRAAVKVLATGGLPECSTARAEVMRGLAERNIPIIDLEEDPLPTAPEPAGQLATLIPPPAARHGQVRTWAVGVTTAPRRRPTLATCLESLRRAGWEEPFLFIDAVDVPHPFSHLPGTARDLRIGAWPNYYLGLWELVLRCPDADAYLMVQDDVLFTHRENLPEYLETILWPGTTPCLVSLFTPSSYTQDKNGWNPLPEPWFWGAQAFIFPRALVRDFLTAPEVIAHHDQPNGAGLVGIDRLIGEWADRRGVPIWHPTPSLAQHIGASSSIWPNTAFEGPRRADRFVGN